MVGNPNLKEDNKKTRFKEGNPGGGRRKSRLKKFIQQNDISSNDIENMIKNIIICSTQEELKAMVEDVKKPMIIRYFIKVFLKEFSEGRYIGVKEFINRAIGMPTQKIDASIENKVYRVIPAPDLPDENIDKEK